jgi:hypothetical protein
MQLEKLQRICVLEAPERGSSPRYVVDGDLIQRFYVDLFVQVLQSGLNAALQILTSTLSIGSSASAGSGQHTNTVGAAKLPQDKPEIKPKILDNTP